MRRRRGVAASNTRQGDVFVIQLNPELDLDIDMGM